MKTIEEFCKKENFTKEQLVEELSNLTSFLYEIYGTHEDFNLNKRDIHTLAELICYIQTND